VQWIDVDWEIENIEDDLISRGRLADSRFASRDTLFSTNTQTTRLNTDLNLTLLEDRGVGIHGDFIVQPKEAARQ
jgi:hypothetical protein